MLNLDAEITFGVGAAGITIGQSVASLLEADAPDSIEQRLGCRVLKFGPVWAFEKYKALWGGDESNTLGVVDQVCVRAGYRGKTAVLIGIGSRLAEVEVAFGPLEHVEGACPEEYQLDLGTPWCATDWCLEVEKGSPPMGEPGWRDARISCICVF